MASFKSFLSAAGHDFIAVFKYLGSAQGQADIKNGEAVLNTVLNAANPALALAVNGVEVLINAGIKSALNIEASTALVGAQSGTGAQKLAAVVASLDSKAEEFLVSIGVSAPTASQVQVLSTAIGSGVAGVLNAIPPVTPAPVAAA